MPQLSHLKGRGAGVFIHQLPNRHPLRAAAGLGLGSLSLWQFLPATCEQSQLQQLENTLHHHLPPTPAAASHRAAEAESPKSVLGTTVMRPQEIQGRGGGTHSHLYGTVVTIVAVVTNCS